MGGEGGRGGGGEGGGEMKGRWERWGDLFLWRNGEDREGKRGREKGR